MSNVVTNPAALPVNAQIHADGFTMRGESGMR